MGNSLNYLTIPFSLLPPTATWKVEVIISLILITQINEWQHISSERIQDKKHSALDSPENMEEHVWVVLRSDDSRWHLVMSPSSPDPAFSLLPSLQSIFSHAWGSARLHNKWSIHLRDLFSLDERTLPNLSILAAMCTQDEAKKNQIKKKDLLKGSCKP